MSKPSAIQKLFDLLQAALDSGSLVKLTLSAPRGADKSLKNVQIRAIELKGVPHLSFVYHHAHRDVTKNFPIAEGLELLGDILGTDFRNAHLFTTNGSAQLEIRDGHGARLIEGRPQHATPAPVLHDQPKQRRIGAASAWLRGLGVTTPDGKVARGMEAKYRQIDKFVEIAGALLNEAGLDQADPIRVADMGCGKGYLTFALYESLRKGGGRTIQVRGVEARSELVRNSQRVAEESGFDGLTFIEGTIDSVEPGPIDVLIALHACDTATDDALAKGIGAGARLLIVSPCCHKELRPQLVPPAPLVNTFQHGILRERQAEFITDALRAALLEWAGYRTKVFEFISTEHTAKNLMITAVRRTDFTGPTEEDAEAVRRLAGLYGIRSQKLAAALGLSLTQSALPA